MNLRQLEAFHAIVSSGSFGTAAVQAHLTRSALSHQIKSLEEELGKKLLVRAKPKVYPTPRGVKEKFGLLPGGEQRSLKVAATNVGLNYIYGDLCERFIAAHPDTELNIITTETTEDAVIRVARQSVDLAFTTLPVDVPDLQSVHLGDSEQVFIVGNSHPLAKKRAVTFAEIHDFLFVRFVPGSGGRDFTDSMFAKSGGYPPIMTETNDTEVVKRIVRMGLAIALVPAFSIVAELQRKSLRALRLSSGKMMQPFGIVQRRDSTNAALDMFRALCLKQRGSTPVKVRLENLGRAPWTIDHDEPRELKGKALKKATLGHRKAKTNPRGRADRA
jgi:DNA-binding transcriptional LysR family regulator